MKAVLVTGANSGIGFYTAKRLLANGFYVYAGIRNPSRFAVFHNTENVEIIQLDVTSQDDIDAAVAHVEKQGRGLYGVINNAGIQRFSKMNTIGDEVLYELFETNVFGPLRVNRAFADLLIGSQGRTVTVGSISAFRPCNGSGAYAMTKAAISSYMDSYHMEMAEYNVHATIVELGGYNTNILLNADNESLPDDVREGIQRRIKAYKFIGTPPHEVADKLLDIMVCDSPKRRYMIVPREEQAETAIKCTMTKVAELNSTQSYEYSKEELITMLEKLLDESSSE
jgi:3-hydroxybutyrate dehydrogenase